MDMRYGHRWFPKVWFTLIALDTMVEVWALRGRRREATLSHFMRCSFRTHHWCGRTAFVVFWSGLTAWLVPHILREPKS